MAGINLYHETEIVPDENTPQTIVQIGAPTNHRLLLKAVELQPLGSSGASAPLKFDISLQTTTGTSTDDSSAIRKKAPVGAEAVQATMRKAFTVEPAASTPKESMTLHQMASRTYWSPQGGPIVIEGGTYVGVRCLTATTVSVKIALHMEE